jgi:hypothetical protein
MAQPRQHAGKACSFSTPVVTVGRSSFLRLRCLIEQLDLDWIWQSTLAIGMLANQTRGCCHTQRCSRAVAQGAYSMCIACCAGACMCSAIAASKVCAPSLHRPSALLIFVLLRMLIVVPVCRVTWLHARAPTPQGP